MHRHNIIVTGISRSGTTLTVRLLNQLPNVVALHEPFKSSDLPVCGGEAACDAIQRFYEDMRVSISRHGTAISNHVNGIPFNDYEKLEMNDDGSRVKAEVRRGPILIEKQLPPD